MYTLKRPGRYHVQYIQRFSCATCCVTCLVVQRDSSAIKLTELKSHIINLFELYYIGWAMINTHRHRSTRLLNSHTKDPCIVSISPWSQNCTLIFLFVWHWLGHHWFKHWAKPINHQTEKNFNLTLDQLLTLILSYHCLLVISFMTSGILRFWPVLVPTFFRLETMTTIFSISVSFVSVIIF